MRAPSSSTRVSSRPGSISAGLTAERGHAEAARRHLKKAIALDADYADAVFNLAKLEFDAGDLAEARRWWARYLELDSQSEWARTPPAASSSSTSQLARAERAAEMVRAFLFDGPADATRHDPARAWRRRADGFGVDDRHGQALAAAASASPASSSATWRPAARRGAQAAAARRDADPRIPSPRSPSSRAATARSSSAASRWAAASPAWSPTSFTPPARSPACVCLGYPFHPPGRPEQLRTEHLDELRTPALICQGTRDAFGTREEVAGYRSPTASRSSGWRTATTTSSRARASRAFRPPII